MSVASLHLLKYRSWRPAEIRTLNVYFLPTQVWGDITDAHDAVQSLHLSTPSFVEVLGSDSQQAIGIQIPTTETVSDCTDQWDADRRACDDDLDDDLRDCYDDAEFAENLCKNSRRTSELAADVRLATCLNNVGLLDRLGAACTAGGGGVIVGGGIGFIFKGIGAVPGGIIGGCAGFVGGFIGGAAVARAECRKDHDTDYKVAAALFDDCMDRAWDDYIDCRADADDAWEDCRAAAEAAYTRCLENATIIP